MIFSISALVSAQDSHIKPDSEATMIFFAVKRFSNERELVQWENLIADAYLQRQEMKEYDKLETKVQLTQQR
jgi:hypothetical protein